ncbi:MAG: hypothetical protein WC834_02975, partial [Eubacteriales bacterium]
GEAVLTGDNKELIGRITRLEELLAQGQTVSGAAADTPGQTKPRPGKPNEERPAPENKPACLEQENTIDGGQAQMVDAEMIRTCWQEILDRIKKVRMSAQAFLIEGKPVDVKDGSLILSFPAEYGFHKEKVEQPENKNAIEQVLKEVTGTRLRLKCKFVSEFAEETERVSIPVKKDTIVEEAIRLFGEDVIEIKD